MIDKRYENPAEIKDKNRYMSIIKIDMNSPEFIAEMEKTIAFTDKVCKSQGWVYNPQEEVNEGVQMGLARNKMMYGKRFCPCFMVEEVDGKPKSVDNRICPCKPAIENEIPNEGKCHCGIFCTPEYAQAKKEELGIEEVTLTESGKLILTFGDSPNVPPEKIVKLVKETKATFTPDRKLYSTANTLEEVVSFLESLKGKHCEQES